MSGSTQSAQAAEARHLLQVYGQLAIEPESASGVHIRLKDGREILDLYGGHAVAGLGYGHPACVRTLAEQAETLTFQSNAVALDVRAQAADKLCAFAPAGLDRVFFVNTGAEANENALRIALKHSGRTKVLAIEHGFHGRSAAAGAVTWGARDSWYAFPTTPFETGFIKRDDPDSAAELIDADTAAVIVELVQGVAGAYDLDPAFVTTLAERCAETGALLIVDEVQTGMGRCGAAFAADLYGLAPDILTVAKALGGGFPCGAVLLTPDVAAGLSNGDLGTTFGGGPMACALISAVIDEIESGGLIDNVRARSAELREAVPVGPVTAVQGHGFLMGLTCTRPAAGVRDALLRHDILVGTSGDPDVIRLLPPLTLEREHVQRFVDTLAAID